MNPKRPLTPERYYRLPWNLADNAITWLEPTTKCNLYCEGCYRENDPAGHKPLEDVIRDLEVGRSLRRTDGISIAGGEPLIYPHIVDLVRYVASQGWKPIINSNGQALTPALVRELTRAGLVGFTMHVDSHQKRPGWIGKSEMELCELRLHLAKMISENSKGKVACAFNATIYRDTLDDVPKLTRWAQEHMDIVQTMVFILFRSIKAQDGHECYVHGERINPGDLVYQLDHMEEHKDIVAQEVADKIREVYPDFEPCAYLNGSEDPRSMKWLLTMRVGNPKRILGYLDPKFAEMTQAFHHLFFDSYVAYTRPWLTRTAQALFPLALINKSLRKIFGRWLARPFEWLECLDIQSIMIIQPCDLFEDGRQNMCDGCPDAIHYKGKMVWSCRVDELEKFGGFVSCAPRGCAASCSGETKAADREKPVVAPLVVRPEAVLAVREANELAVKQDAPVAVKEPAPVVVREQTPPAPVETPVPEPVAAAPVETPVEAPAPVAEPAPEKTEAPVEAPAPMAEPEPVAAEPVIAPVEPAVAEPEPVAAAPVETPVETPVEAPVEAPAPVAEPVPVAAEPVIAPVEPAVAEPEPEKTEAPVEALAPVATVKGGKAPGKAGKKAASGKSDKPKAKAGKAKTAKKK